MHLNAILVSTVYEPGSGIVLLAICLFGVMLVGTLAYAFHSLVSLDNSADHEWAELDAMLQRRYDLAEKLNGDSALQDAVKVARNAVTVEEKSRTEPAVVAALEKALQNKASNAGDAAILRSQIDDISKAIQAQQRRYNLIADNLNTTMGMFPQNVMSRFLGTRARQAFHIESQA